MIATDFGCVGDHGIGRFAKEVFARCKLQPIEVGKSPTSATYNYHLARAIEKSDATVYFSPSYMPPLWSKIKFVFTIHDLNHIDRPENSSFLKKLYYRLFLKSGCRRAAKVLTVSEFSRGRILAWSGLPPDRVVNVGNGVDPVYSPVGDVYAPGYRYFLCVSNRRGHKNEAGLLRAFASVRLANDVKLILTGNPTPEIEAILQAEALASSVVFTGLVPEEQLPALYRGAIALVFPSFYEGFGLPVVEAMACGAPVITSNVTSLPEVAGGAALLVDPNSTSAIAAAMGRILDEPELGKSLTEKGLRQARKFSWDDVAARINAVLHEVEQQ